MLVNRTLSHGHVVRVTSNEPMHKTMKLSLIDGSRAIRAGPNPVFKRERDSLVVVPFVLLTRNWRYRPTFSSALAGRLSPGRR